MFITQYFLVFGQWLVLLLSTILLDETALESENSVVLIDIAVRVFSLGDLQICYVIAVEFFILVKTLASLWFWRIRARASGQRCRTFLPDLASSLRIFDFDLRRSLGPPKSLVSFGSLSELLLINVAVSQHLCH